MKNEIDHPDHYGGKANPYEAIKIIEAWNMGFHLGNVLKYILRANNKGGLQDLLKARWYLNRQIEKLDHTRVEQPKVDG